jgi:hypothetical protein
MSETTSTDTPITRRRFAAAAAGAGLAGAAAGAGLRPGSAHAFDLTAPARFTTASTLLRPEGVAVGGSRVDGRDVVRVAAAPVGTNGYDYTLSAAAGVLGSPRVVTSYRPGALAFLMFPNGGIDQCIRVAAAAATRTVSFFDVNASAGLDECVRVSVERRPDQSFGAVRIALDLGLDDLRITVGHREYVLQAGALRAND